MTKKILVILFATFSSFALADKARIAVSQTPLSSPFFIAEKRSLFAAHGVNVEIVDRIGGHRSMKAMLNNEADYATSSDMVIMNSARKGSAFSVLATFVSSALDMALIGSKKAGVTEPSHLKGKIIGVTKGTASHYFADT